MSGKNCDRDFFSHWKQEQKIYRRGFLKIPSAGKNTRHVYKIKTAMVIFSATENSVGKFTTTDF